MNIRYLSFNDKSLGTFRCFFGGALLIVAAAISSFSSAAAQATRERVLVTDLENKTFDAEQNWVGSAISYYIRKTLESTGRYEVLPHRSRGVNLFDGDLDQVVSGEYRLEQGSFVVTAVLEAPARPSDKRYFLTEGTKEHVLRMARYFAEQVTRELGVPLLPEDLSGAAWGGTESVEAFEDFIKAINERRLMEKVQYYDRAVALDPRFALAHLHLGLISIYADRWRRAESELEKAASILPEDADIHNNLGYVYGRLGKLEKAEREFREAATLAPSSVKFKLNLGDTLRSLGRTAEARQVFEEVLARDPANSEATAAIAELEGEKAGQKALVATLSSAPEVKGADVGTPEVRPEAPGTTAEGAGAAAAPATPEPSPALADRPAEPAPAARGERSVPPRTAPPAHLEAEVEPGESEESVLRTARDLDAEGRPIEARRALLEGTRRFPKSALLKDALKKGPKALREIDPVLEELEDFPADRRAEILGRLAEALKAFEAGRSGAGHRILGVLYLSTDRDYAALSLLRQAVKEDPQDRDAHHYLAEVYRRLNRPKEAEKQQALSGR